MSEHPNPYAAPHSSLAKGRFRPSSLFWPNSWVGCMLLAYLGPPVVFTFVDLVGWILERRLGFDGIDLIVTDVSISAGWLIGFVLWCRGWIKIHESGGFLLALLAIPIWLVPMGWISLIFFPFGRIDPNF